MLSYMDHLSTIAGVVHTAFNGGILPLAPMTLCGVTITLDVKAHWCVMTVSTVRATYSVNLYDTDSETANLAAITDLIASVL